MNRQEFFKKYKENEEWNNHGENVLLCCKYFNRPLDVKKMEHINALHDLYGHLTEELYAMRTEIWDSVSELFYKEKNLYLAETMSTTK